MLSGIDSSDPVLLAAIDSGNKTAVADWIARYRPLEHKTVKELRVIAAQMGCVGYQSLGKCALIFLIQGGKDGTTNTITQGNEAPMYACSH